MLKLIMNYHVVTQEEDCLLFTPQDIYTPKIKLYPYGDEMDLSILDIMCTVIDDAFSFEAVDIGDKRYEKVTLSLQKLINNQKMLIRIASEEDGSLLYDITETVEKYEMI